MFSVLSVFEPGKSYSFGVIFLMVLAYALLPAICEEVLFRGILCAVYEQRGFLPSFVMSTLFFTLIHLNAAGIAVFMFSGAILWLLFYATSGLYVTIGIHFFYNLFCLFGLPYISTYYGESFDPALFMFSVTLIFLASATVFCASNAGIYRKREKTSDKSQLDMPRLSIETLKFICDELISFGSIAAITAYIIYSLTR
jgi:hypothetical protein